MMFASCTHHVMRIVVSRDQALGALAYARRHDVEWGGLYDVRAAAIHIWSCPWDTPAHKQASTLVGTIYLAWSTPHLDLATIRRLDVAPGYALAEVERHLALLFGGD